MPAVIDAEQDSIRDGDIDLDQTILDLTSASRLPAKTRSYQVRPLIHSICSFGRQQGLPNLALTTILDIVTLPNQLDQASLATLIKGLYPAERISSHLVCMVVSSFGQGQQKPSLAVQNHLLKWLILVYEVLEDPTTLTKLYGTLFNMLDMISIRANLCHLLAMITRRKHVKPFRVQMLLELSRTFGDEPPLLGLLRVYKEYYPDIIVGEESTRKQQCFEHPDPSWRDRLHLIHDANTGDSLRGQTGDSVFEVSRRRGTRGHASFVPEVHTYISCQSSTSLEEVHDIEDFVEKFDRIELPNQMISVLDDPLLQKLVNLKDGEMANRRIDNWLSSFLASHIQAMSEEDGKGMSKQLIEILEKTLSYTMYTKVLSKPVQIFLTEFMDIWDGQDKRDLILGLLAYLPIGSFEDLRASILSKLEDAVLDNTSESSSALLEYYTLLLRQWTSQLLALTDSPPANTAPSLSALGALINHASLLSLHTLAASPPTQSTISSILTYHEALAYTISHAPTHHYIYIHTPLPQTVYLLTFLSPSLSNLSRLCSILAIYKRTFEASITQPNQSGHQYPRDYVNSFNGFLMDICNLLWRTRAFNKTDTNALGCLLPPTVFSALNIYTETLSPPQSLSTLFSLSHNPSLSALSIAAFRDLEDKAVDEDGFAPMLNTRHAGPVTQRSLASLAVDGGLKITWADYRLEVLNWLEERGVEGVGELMFCTMRHLMKGKPAPITTS